MQFVLRHRLMITIICGGTGLLLMAAVGLFGLLRGPQPISRPELPAKDWATPSPSPSVGDLPTGDSPSPVLKTRDATDFVRSVATSLFDWDTRQSVDPSELAQPLVDAADIDEAPAVASDVRNYLPGEQMWDRLRMYGTRQWLEIDSVSVPDTWSTAIDQATPGQIPPGAVAFTISGTRHRAGSWGVEPVRSNRAVAFTVFAMCPNANDCTLLRLSKLNNPLK